MVPQDAFMRRINVLPTVAALIAIGGWLIVTMGCGERFDDGRREATNWVGEQGDVIQVDQFQAPHLSALQTAEFTHDSQFLITESGDGEVVLWDGRSGQRIRNIIPGGQADRYHTARSGTRQYYLGLFNDASILLGHRVWQSEKEQVAWLELHDLDETTPTSESTGTRRFELAEAAAPYWSSMPYFAAFSHDDRYLVARSQDGLHVWNVQTRERVWDPNRELPDSKAVLPAEIQRFSEEPWWLGNSSAALERLVVCANARPDGIALRWKGSFFIPGEGIRIRFGPQGKRYVTSHWRDSDSTDDEVVLWDVANRKPVRKIWRPYTDPQHLHFTSDGASYLERGDDPTVLDLRDGMTDELIHSFSHDSPVTARALSPDDKSCLSACESGRVMLWDLRTGKKTVEVYIGHDPIVSVDFRFDSRQCLIGTKMNAISLELPTGKVAVLFKCERPGESVGGIARYSPDGLRVVTMSSGNKLGQASLWNAKTGTRLSLLATLPTHDIWLSPRGRLALCVPANRPTVQKIVPNEVSLRRTATGEVLHVFKNDSADVYLPDRRRDYDYKFVWQNARSTEQRFVEPVSVKTTADPNETSRQLKFSLRPPQEKVISEIAGLDDEQREWLWNLVEKKVPPNEPGVPTIRWTRKLANGGYRPTSPSRHPSSSVIVAVRPDIARDIEKLTAGQVTFEFTGDAAPMDVDTATHQQTWIATAAALSSDRSVMLVAYRRQSETVERKLVLWDIHACKQLKTFESKDIGFPDSGDVESLLISLDHRYAAIGFAHHGYLLNLETGRSFDIGKPYTWLRANKEFARFSPDSRRLIFFDKSMSLWDTSQAEKLGELKSNALPNAIVFSPNSQFVVSIDRHRPDLWDATTGDKLVLDNSGFGVGLFAMSPDGTRMVVAASAAARRDGRLQLTLWNLQTGRSLGKLFVEGKRPRAHDFIFSPDSTRLVATYEHQLAVWNAKTGQQIGSAEWPEDDFADSHNQQRPVFLGERRLLVSHSHGAHLWDLDAVEPVFVFSSPKSQHHFVRLVAGNQKLLTVSPGHDATLWDLRTGHKLITFSDIPHDLTFGRDPVRFSKDGLHLYAFHRSGQAVAVWETKTGQMIRQHYLMDHGNRWDTYKLE